MLARPGPLAVRLEQLRRLPAFDLTAAQRAQKLDEPEVADEAVVVPAEPFEADDADRPRAEPALALEPLRDHRRRSMSCRRSSSTVPAEADERRRRAAHAGRAHAAATARARRGRRVVGATCSRSARRRRSSG